MGGALERHRFPTIALNVIRLVRGHFTWTREIFPKANLANGGKMLTRTQVERKSPGFMMAQPVFPVGK